MKRARTTDPVPAPGDGRLVLIDLVEVQQRLQTSRSFVHDLIRRGELKSVKIGRSRRVRLSDLAEFIAAREAV